MLSLKLRAREVAALLRHLEKDLFPTSVWIIWHVLINLYTPRQHDEKPSAVAMLLNFFLQIPESEHSFIIFTCHVI